LSILTKYILIRYLKSFFLILISLEIFFVLIDFLQNTAHLPNSANLQILYIFYTSFFTFSITLPLSLVFAFIVVMVGFVKQNNMTSFYSLGIKPLNILMPIIWCSIAITLILILLQTTPLAYSYEQKSRILNNSYFTTVQENIFLKYNEYFIYFEKLFPLQKKANNIRIFKTEHNNIIEIIIGKKAYYENNKWCVLDTKIIKKPITINWDSSKLTIGYKKLLYTLEGFKPKIINNVSRANIQFSIKDAIYTILLLDKQNLDTQKIRAILYSQVIIPFFVIPLIVIIFFFTTVSSREFNVAKFSSVSIFFTLIIWGIIYFLQKLAFNGVILAELATILPIIILYGFAYYIYKKRV